MKTGKKFISLLLVVVMMVCSVTMVASAEVYSGNCGDNGDNVTWTLDTESGVLRISGEGHMDHYFLFNSNPDLDLPWKDYRQYIKTLIVEDGVKDVGSSICIGCKNLTSVTLSDDVEYIGYSSFYGCENLEQIDLGDSLRNIDKTTFMFSGLKSIDIPDGVTMIPDQAFQYCQNLEEVTIPSSVTYISMGAFGDCPNLKSITIPEGVKEISGWSFQNCTSLKTITLPSSLEKIYFYVFDNCTALESVVISEGLQTIGETSFYRCSGLKSVTIPYSVTTIEENAFFACPSITDVYYAGSEEEWNEIVIESGNDDLIKAKVHFGRVEEKPEEPSEDCSCNCHASGIKKFFFNFILFFQKLFRKNAVCACGIAHY